jgi:hypothetical protein
MNNNKKTNKREDDRWVDVHNDALMVELGIRPKDREPRDKSVWTKTSQETKLLKKLRRQFKHINGHFHNIPQKHIPVWGKLIIYLFKNNKFSKSTYSTKCWQHDIPNIISSYTVRSKDSFKNVVMKYSWNGKTYNSNEFPYWGVK